jgi:ubiquinone/menaquinone biosynthesis C-methylase UbiE
MEKQKKNIIEHFKNRNLTYCEDNYSQNSNYYRISRKEYFVQTVQKYMCPGETLLDLGCGPGVMSEEASLYGWNHTCFDLSFENLRRIRLQTQRVAGDMEFLPFSENSFDFAIAMGSIEYVPDWKKCLREAHRVVKPNGLIIISFPNKHSYYRIWSEYVYGPLSVRIKNLIEKNTPVYRRTLFTKSEILFYISTFMSVINFTYTNPVVFIQPFDRIFKKLYVDMAKRFGSKTNIPALFASEMILLMKVIK